MNRITYSLNYRKPKEEYNPNDELVICLRYFYKNPDSNKSKIIKSYMLLKIVFDSDRFIIALGSKNINKFTKDQKVDLIEYLILIIINL